MILSGNTLYGTTQWGGSSGNNGTVFALNTDGTGFTTLHSFAGGSDGGSPHAGLILSGDTLYGTAERGSSGNGTVFAVNTDGTSFTVLHSFTARSDGGYGTNSDGAQPIAGLILSSNTLYGTAINGGSSGYGTVFAVSTDGTGFTVLHGFTAGAYNSSSFYTNSEGTGPSGLILSGDTLYGTAGDGGSSGNGTIFSISLLPQLTIIPSRTNLILTWPTNATGYTLQSTTNLGSAAVWSTNSTAPVVVNGQNTVTNPISRTQQFFRLSQ